MEKKNPQRKFYKLYIHSLIINNLRLVNSTFEAQIIGQSTTKKKYKSKKYIYRTLRPSFFEK